MLAIFILLLHMTTEKEVAINEIGAENFEITPANKSEELKACLEEGVRSSALRIVSIVSFLA